MPTDFQPTSLQRRLGLAEQRNATLETDLRQAQVCMPTEPREREPDDKQRDLLIHSKETF